MMMMTFMEVKGNQRPNVVNYALCLPFIWSKESLMQVYDDDDLHGGQRSNGIKYGLKHHQTIF